MGNQKYDRYWIGRMARRVKLANIAPQPGGVIDRYIGYCWTCRAGRSESECRQVERDECCMYACRICDSTIDESEPPF